jgi:hypothetical protein
MHDRQEPRGIAHPDYQAQAFIEHSSFPTWVVEGEPRREPLQVRFFPVMPSVTEP